MVPAGTAMPLRTAVAHDLIDALAADASVNVQVVARFSIDEPWVSKFVGAATASAAIVRNEVEKYILKRVYLLRI